MINAWTLLMKAVFRDTLRDTSEHRKTRRQIEIENYLAESVDLVDLERRERELEKQGYYW